MTPIHIPRWLRAPSPGWSTSADVIVVGSGIAGLTAALRLRARGATVLLVTKTLLTEGSTAWAQGGIAAALDPEDSPEEQLEDTLVAGVGLCDEGAVRVLVTEGPQRVRELVALAKEHFSGAPQGSRVHGFVPCALCILAHKNLPRFLKELSLHRMHETSC